MCAAVNSQAGVWYEHEEYAGTWRRILVDIIDVIVAACLSAVMLTFALIPIADPEGPAASAVVLFILIAVFICYFILLKWSEYRTLGYIVCGVRIVNIKGEAPSLWAIFVRALFGVLGPLNFLLDLIWISSDSNRQALRDKFAHTYVVLKNAEAAGQGPLVYRHYDILGWAFTFLEVLPQEPSHAP